MLDQLSGATRVHVIVGDPIAQVKSPFGMTQAFELEGQNAICIPAQVPAKDLKQWFEGITLARNVDGIIVTVPHKFDCHAFCMTHSPSADFLGAVNTMRRNADGSWHGDMFDGLGYVKAIASKGFQLPGKKALLVGAGGAGSAIAHALVMAGIHELAIYDENTARSKALIERLNSLNRCPVRAGSTQAKGYDIAINATPAGMRDGDNFPIDIEGITSQMFIGCVITAPAISPLIAAARAKGCQTVTGADMFVQVRQQMLAFLLGGEKI